MEYAITPKIERMITMKMECDARFAKAVQACVEVGLSEKYGLDVKFGEDMEYAFEDKLTATIAAMIKSSADALRNDCLQSLKRNLGEPAAGLEKRGTGRPKMSDAKKSPLNRAGYIVTEPGVCAVVTFWLNPALPHLWEEKRQLFEGLFAKGLENKEIKCADYKYDDGRIQITTGEFINQSPYKIFSGIRNFATGCYTGKIKKESPNITEDEIKKCRLFDGKWEVSLIHPDGSSALVVKYPK